MLVFTRYIGQAFYIGGRAMQITFKDVYHNGFILSVKTVNGTSDIHMPFFEDTTITHTDGSSIILKALPVERKASKHMLRVGIEAPKHLTVNREEIQDKIDLAELKALMEIK